MDNLIIFSWSAYLVSTAFLVLASWKLLSWLPFTFKLGIFFTQLAILLVPAEINVTAKAPAFIVLVIDLLSRVPMDEVITKATPLALAIALAWPLAFILGWLKARLLNSAAEKPAANLDIEAEAASETSQTL